MQTPENPDKNRPSPKKKDAALSGLIFLSNLPAVIALVAYLIWRFW